MGQRAIVVVDIQNEYFCARYTLTDHMWRYLQDYAEKHRRKGNGFGFGLAGPDDVARTLSARYYKDGSENPDSPEEQKSPPSDTPRMCLTDGFRPAGRVNFHYPGFGHASLPAIRKCGGCERRGDRGAAHASVDNLPRNLSPGFVGRPPSGLTPGWT